MRSRIEKTFGIELDIDSAIIPWLIRHASWLMNRFSVKTDGRTPYERTKGRPYNGELAGFGESVL